MKKGLALLIAACVGMVLPAASALTARDSRAATAAAGTEAAIDPALWSAWKTAFVEASGRVVDTGNRGISHTEGQGYGMLLAAMAGDADTFKRLWSWTVGHLGIRDDALFAWSYDPAAKPPVVDRNNATDGDILIAWALMQASRRFDAPEYRKAAALIARAVASATFGDSGSGRILLPGAAGFSAGDRRDGPVVNLSYWVYPAFADLAAAAPEYDWARLARTGLAITESARFGASHLPTDWLSLAGDTPRPADGFPPEFGWNALRVPLYIAWAGIGVQSQLAPYAAAWPDPAAVPSVVNVTSGAMRSFGGAEYAAVPALVACALEGRKLDPALKSPAMDQYYPSTLRLLVLAAASERYPACL